MKFVAFLFLSCVLTVQAAVILDDPIEDARKSAVCRRQYKGNPKSIQRLSSGHFDDDPRFKEYMWCISKVAGYLNNDGEFQNDVIRLRLTSSHLSKEAVDSVMESCTNKKQTPQETAFQFVKCVHDQVIQKLKIHTSSN